MIEKIELVKSAKRLSDFWGVEINTLLKWAAMLDEEKKDEWNEIAKEVCEFYNKPLEERASDMGWEVEDKLSD